MAQALVIDTDPGIDDALAILLALASPEVDVRALSTVSGNVGLAQASANARAVLALAGRSEIPVSPGAARPLHRAPAHAEAVHGDDGLGGAPLPRPGPRADEIPALAQWEALTEAPGRVALAAIGPLTNLAAFTRRFPARVGAFARVVAMGGGWGVGNVTATAEFNAWVDPEAMAEVLASGLRPDLLALETTRQARLGEREIARLRAGGPVGAQAAAWLAAGRRADGCSAPIHDAVAIAALVRPALVSFREVRVEVDCGEERRGETRISTTGPPNARIAVGFDRAGFAALLADRLAAAGRRADAGPDDPGRQDGSTRR